MLTPLNLPLDSPPPDPDRTHPLLYAEACLRCAYFLLAVYEAHGSMQKALDRLVSPPSSSTTPPTSTADPDTSQSRSAQLASLAPSNTVPRSSIALWISTAYSPHLATLSLPIRLRITSEVASLFGRIGYRRKEAFVLRELAALCAEGVVGRGIEVLPGVRGGGNSGIPSPIPEEGGPSHPPTHANGIHKPTPRLTNDRLSNLVRTTSSSAGNDSIIRLSERVCEAFGIRVAPRAPGGKKKNRMSVMQGRALEITESGTGVFGWPGLQVGVLKDAIAIAESLPGQSNSNYSAM